MPDDPNRSKDDIERARKIALSFLEAGRSAAVRRSLSDRFDDLVREVANNNDRPPTFLSDAQRAELQESFRATWRVFGFSQAVDFPYVLALVGVSNVYDAPVIIDVFSPEALRGVGYTGPAPPMGDDRHQEWRDYRGLIDDIAKRGDQATPVRLEEAAPGVLALFIDTLRAMARGGGGGSGGGGGGGPPMAGTPSTATTTNFRVDSANQGYRLHVFRQWKYRPRVYGNGALSWPVYDNLATGHWCFEGDLKNGPRIRDRATHFCDPTHTSTTTTAF
jgi:hypothetical protein